MEKLIVFFELDMPNSLTIHLVEIQFVQYQILISKAIYVLSMSDVSNRVVLSGITNEVAHDAIKLMLKQPYDFKYLSGVQQTSNQNTSSVRHM